MGFSPKALNFSVCSIMLNADKRYETVSGKIFLNVKLTGKRTGVVSVIPLPVSSIFQLQSEAARAVETVSAEFALRQSDSLDQRFEFVKPE